MAHVLADMAAPLPVAAVPGRRWADFWVRLASAAILAPLALVALWVGGGAWVAAVAVTLAGLGAEWAGLTVNATRFVLPGLLLVAMAVALVVGWIAGFAVLGVGALVVAWRHGGWAAAGMPYAGIAGLSLLWLRLTQPGGCHDVVFLLAVVWATDIGAYGAGRLIGGAKMAPRISPGKTWSGAVGGTACAVLAGLAVSGPHIAAALVALPLSLLAQAGDLMESAIKRRRGVKDSGRSIPGHGGLFDRLDGVLAAAPAVAVLVLIQGSLPAWP